MGMDKVTAFKFISTVKKALNGGGTATISPIVKVCCGDRAEVGIAAH